MKRSFKSLIAILLLLCTLIGSFASCTPDDPDNGGNHTHVDYVSRVTLDINSDSLKQAVTVKTYIDGDTTHFYVPNSVSDGGVLKARYLAINTPESTGKIEEYGKKASDFTKERLKSATSIIVESDDGNWNVDSTGGRHLVWVWYKTAEDAEYRNLNLEILQNGLAKASNTGDNRYGTECLAALEQAKIEKLNVFSGEKDPGFYYGDALELTLKELRYNITDYQNVKVAFEGIVTRNSGQDGVYVESYDEETDMYYGIYVYYGTTNIGKIKEALGVGNKVRVVGNVTEFNGSWQVSGLEYRAMKPNDPSNTQRVDDLTYEPAYVETSADTFVNGKVQATVGVEGEQVEKEFSYAELATNSSIYMKNLTVVSVYTTDSDTASNGAMTITCRVDGIEIDVRTIVLFDGSDQLITADSFPIGSTFNVKGIVDCFNGDYQIKVFTMDSFEFITE